MSKIVIGLDAGVNFGIAKYVDGQLRGIETRKPMDALKFVEAQNAGTLIVLEDSRLQSYVWAGRGKAKLQQAQMLKISRNIGEIDCYCRLIEAICKERGLKLLNISPKDKGEKLKAQEFNEATGWSGGSNQHERDAAICAWRFRNGVAA